MVNGTHGNSPTGNNTMHVDTRHFLNSHGRRPRGPGSWAFSTTPDHRPPTGMFDARVNPTGIWFSPAGTLYADAKRMARKVFAVTRYDTIYVLPDAF